MIKRKARYTIDDIVNLSPRDVVDLLNSRESRPSVGKKDSDTAKELLDSGWPFTGLDRKSPSEVRAFLENIASGYFDEEGLSPQQGLFLVSCISKHRKWIADKKTGLNQW